MKTLTAQLILGAMILVPASMFGQAYTEGTINIAGATYVPVPYGIDANNQISGYFADNLGTHGFLLSTGVLTQVDQPGAQQTYMMGIDATKGMVGYVTNSGVDSGVKDAGRSYKALAGSSGKVISGISATGAFVGYEGAGHAFINSGGVYTNVVPAPCAAMPLPRRIFIYGVNAHNDMVGYCYGGGQTSGFARVGGVDRAISVFGTTAYPTGINDAGTIGGWFLDASGFGHGFVLTGATAKQFDFVGAHSYSATLIYGINNAGSLVGTTFDTALGYYVGFYAFAN